jgi:hypothetical protein
MAHVVNPWEGGCRAAGAAWESDSYTREGLANTNVLTHAFQKEVESSDATQLVQQKKTIFCHICGNDKTTNS